MTIADGITIGSIRNAAEAYYHSARRKPSFRQAMQLARPYTEMPPKNDEGQLMTDDEFVALINSLPINIQKHREDDMEPFPQYFGNFYMRQSTTFLAQNDIMPHIHIPCIFDGIHTHDHFELNYVYRGDCELDFNGEKKNLGMGMFCILAPDSPHNITTMGDSIIITMVVRKSTFSSAFASFLKVNCFLTEFFQKSSYGAVDPSCLIFNAGTSENLRLYLQNLFRQFYSNSCFGNVNALCMLSLIFSHIIQQHSDISISYFFGDSSDGDLNFAMLLQYIRQHYNTITLASLSQYFHYSEAYLSRQIFKRTGIGFSDIVRDIRLGHAKALLSGSRSSVAQISEMIGYASPNHFSRVFKKQTGMSPNTYRKMNSIE